MLFYYLYHDARLVVSNKVRNNSCLCLPATSHVRNVCTFQAIINYSYISLVRISFTTVEKMLKNSLYLLIRLENQVDPSLNVVVLYGSFIDRGLLLQLSNS